MLFDALEEELKARLVNQNHPRAYGDGQIIHHRGEKADGFWLIDEGAVRIGQFLPDGEFRAMAVLGRGDSWGELAMFTQRPRVVDAVSRGEARVRFIPAGAFLPALAEYPGSSHALLSALSAQLQDTIDELTGMRRGTNPSRLAGILVNLAGPDDAVAISQQELAELLGVTRATANTALRTLEEGGFIRRGYRKIVIAERERLALFALQ